MQNFKKIHPCEAAAGAKKNGKIGVKLVQMVKLVQDLLGNFIYSTIVCNDTPLS